MHITPHSSGDTLSRYCVACLLLLGGCAELVAREANDESWKFNFTPYVWGTELQGSVASLPGVPPADIDVSLSEMLSNLDIGLMGAGGARKGSFGVFGDLFYSRISTATDTHRVHSVNMAVSAPTAALGVSWGAHDG